MDEIFAGPREPERIVFRPGDRSRSRDRLRAFQSGLAERLQQAREQPAGLTMLAVFFGTQPCLLALDEVSEIMALPALTPVPHVQPWFLGVANLRGRLVSVADLSQYCGHEPLPIDKDSRLISVALPLRCNAAFVVSSIAGLRHPDEMESVVPDRPSHSWEGAPLLDATGRIWRPLSLRALVREGTFLRVARGP